MVGDSIFTSTSDERNLALHIEKVTELEVRIIGFSHLACCCRVSQAWKLILEELMSESLGKLRFANELSSRTKKFRSEKKHRSDAVKNQMLYVLKL